MLRNAALLARVALRSPKQRPSISLYTTLSSATLPQTLLIANTKFHHFPKITPSTTTTSTNVRNFASGSLPEYEVFPMPSLSPTMEAGTIAQWLVHPGESFPAGSVLCEIQTDKATLSYEAQDAGFLCKILVDPGIEVACGTGICVVTEEECDFSLFKDFKENAAGAADAPAPAAEATPSPPPPPPPAPTPTPTPVIQSLPSSSSSSGRVIASPLAHMTAKEQGKDLTLVKGTGPGGRIIKADVDEYTTPAVTAPFAAATENLKPITLPNNTQVYESYTTSSSIAEAAQTSKRRVPHYYLSVEINMEELLSLRTKLNAKLSTKNRSTGVTTPGSLTVNDFLLKACAYNMKTTPEINSSWSNDNSTISVYDNVDINVGLGEGNTRINPVLRNVQAKGLVEINRDYTTAFESVGGNVGEVDFGIGTFSYVNLGMYGITTAAAIIMEPQSSVLSIGTISTKLVADLKAGVNEGGSFKGFKEVSVVNVTLSCDHRVVDGAIGAKWLEGFKKSVEDPLTLML